MLDELGTSHVPALLFPLLEAIHGANGNPPRFGGGNAPRDLFLDSPLEVVTELVLEIQLNLASPEQRPQAKRHGVDQMPKSHF